MIAAVICNAFLSCLSASLGAANSQQPNVPLLVSADNAAEPGCYRTPDVRTPNPDQLAERLNSVAESQPGLQRVPLEHRQVAEQLHYAQCGGVQEWKCLRYPGD